MVTKQRWHYSTSVGTTLAKRHFFDGVEDTGLEQQLLINGIEETALLTRHLSDGFGGMALENDVLSNGLGDTALADQHWRNGLDSGKRPLLMEAAY